jgi:hypothetical protein
LSDVDIRRDVTRTNGRSVPQKDGAKAGLAYSITCPRW